MPSVAVPVPGWEIGTVTSPASAALRVTVTSTLPPSATVVVSGPMDTVTDACTAGVLASMESLFPRPPLDRLRSHFCSGLPSEIKVPGAPVFPARYRSKLCLFIK